MLKALKQKQFLNEDIRARFKYALWSGLAVVAASIILQPGRLTDLPGLPFFLALTFFLGIACSLLVVLHYIILPMIFPAFFHAKSWTVWKSLLMHISIGVAMTLIVELFIIPGPFTALSFLKTLYISAVFSLFPITLVVILKQKSLLRRYSQEARQLEQVLITETVADHHSLIELKGDNTSDILRLDAIDLVYIHAADNYIEVYYLENAKIRKTLLRSTLTRAEEALNNKLFFKCHRSYIVNLRHIDAVEGNAQGYLLSLSQVGDKVPVSRSLTKSLRDKMLKAGN